MDTQSNLTICHPRISSGQDATTAILAKSSIPTVLPTNHVLIKVDRFGYSANNITYQTLGEVPHFRYFDFHVAPKDQESGVSPTTHGVTPVWGFGSVIASTLQEIQVGERVYGYLGPTRSLVLPVSPSDVNRYAFYVSRPHFPSDRRFYNQMMRCSMDPLYDPSPKAEDLTMLFRPLFWTAFWFEDWLYTSQYRGGASRILISSASAKTAFCVAYIIRKRATASGDDRQVIGLTSPKNVAFTKRLGLYDHVLEYDEFKDAPVINDPSQKWIYVDVAGNDTLNLGIRHHFSRAKLNLVGSVALGLTNLSPSSTNDSVQWQKNEFSSEVAPSTLEQYFMPEWLSIRRKQLSVETIADMQKEAWTGLMRDCTTWGITIRRVYGGENVKRAYEDVVKGGIPPDLGLVWSMWDSVENARL